LRQIEKKAYSAAGGLLKRNHLLLRIGGKHTRLNVSVLGEINDEDRSQEENANEIACDDEKNVCPRRKKRPNTKMERN